jgi:Fe(3+) dicitrate transport protein
MNPRRVAYRTGFIMIRVLALVVVFLLAFAWCAATNSVDSVRADTVITGTVTVVDTYSRIIPMALREYDRNAIYAGKKTERIDLAEVRGNVVANNARQTFVQVAGLNIWESDAAGIQLGIGGRGLSPNRTSNFTVRQNGYDISADPLGYPESYYTPPFEFLQRIEIVRGAASLRYGTQFGGMLNFEMLQPKNELDAQISLTAGTYGFASASAKIGTNQQQYGAMALYQGKRSDGWRPNSTFDMHTAYVSGYSYLTDELRVTLDGTLMTYLAQQPGGLTDRQFATNPFQSNRSRNWFSVDWSIVSLTIDALLHQHVSLRSISSITHSSRTAVGNLERINVADLGGNRTVISGQFDNMMNESTIQWQPNADTADFLLLAGLRLFRGVTEQKQGDGTSGDDANFTLLHPENPEGSSFRFPNTNVALFTECIWKITDQITLVPGLRYEYIETNADGFFRQTIRDFAGNILSDTAIDERRGRERGFLLAGLGVEFHTGTTSEIYANVSQNYRSITFSDIRVNNPNLRIDTNLQDESGFTFDIGFRGMLDTIVAVDVSAFYLQYNQRIGEEIRSDEPPLFLPYRFRTNIADAYTAGLEATVSANGTAMFGWLFQPTNVRIIVNASLLNGRYSTDAALSIRNNHVEFVPPYTVRTQISFQWGNLSFAPMMSLVGAHFTDATNAQISAAGVSGSIPAYTVVDCSASYSFDRFVVSASVNNATNNVYFTRRAESYPGPGIIPAEIRNAFLTMQYNF